MAKIDRGNRSNQLRTTLHRFFPLFFFVVLCWGMDIAEAKRRHILLYSYHFYFSFSSVFRPVLRWFYDIVL